MIGIFEKIRNLISTSLHSKLIVIVFSLILLLAVPLTVYVSQQQQQTKQHAAGLEENAVDVAQNQTQNLIQSGNPAGCGDKCAEEPPIPPGVMTINYCGQPLTIPAGEVTDIYKSYQNVKNNKDGKDNRYFIYVVKDNADSVKIKVDNVNDIAVEQLSGGPVAFDGKNLTINSSGAFAIHGNPSKTSAIGFCAFGAFCSNESLSLKAEQTKYRIYPSDNCAQLSAEMSFEAAKKSIDGDGGTGKGGLLAAALADVVRTTREASTDVIENADVSQYNLDNQSGVKQVDIKVRIGGDPVPLRLGEKYGVGGLWATAVYSEGGEMDSILKFAENLKDTGNDEVKIAAITDWISQNGVYPSDKVLEQLRSDPNFKNSELADYAAKFMPKDVVTGGFDPGRETLSQTTSIKLNDGRFFCVCRDVALLTVAMARKAGIKNIWYATGNFLDAEGKPQAHAWVMYLNKDGKIRIWDTTNVLGSDLTIDLRKLPQRLRENISSLAIDKPNNEFAGKYMLDVPFPVAQDPETQQVSFELYDTGGKLIPYDSSEGKVRINIKDIPEDGILNYKVKINSTSKGKISTIKMDNGWEAYGGSFEFSASSTDSTFSLMVDTGKGIIPVNPKLFPSKFIDAIDANNQHASNFLHDPPNTSALQVLEQERVSLDLEKNVSELNTQPSPKFLGAFKSSLEKVKERIALLKGERIDDIQQSIATMEKPPPEVEGKLVSLKQLKAGGVFSKGVGGVTSGLGLILGSAIASDYAQTIDNGYLLMAARAANVVGTSQMILVGGRTVAEVSIAAKAAFVAKNAGLFAKSGAGIAAGGGVLGGAAVGLAETTIGTAIATTLYCGVNPKSSMCGCRISGEYGEDKIKLELQKYAVSAGEKINYRVLGYENCPTHVGLETAFGITNLANVQMPMSLKIGESPSILKQLGMGQSDMDKRKKEECKWQPDGRWCLGEFTLPSDLKSGNYKIILNRPSLVSSDYNSGVNIEEYDPNQTLLIKGSDVSVKLPPGLTPTPKLTPLPSPSAFTLNPQGIYNQCLVICDQGTLIAQNFDKMACVQDCDTKFKQAVSGITPTPSLIASPIPISPTISVSVSTPIPTDTSFPTVAPLSSSQCFEKCVDQIADISACQKSCGIPTPTPISALIPTPTSTPVPQSSCPVSLAKADANCDGRVDANDFNKQRDYAISGQITEGQLIIWVNSVWSPVFSSSQ